MEMNHIQRKFTPKHKAWYLTLVVLISLITITHGLPTCPASITGQLSGTIVESGVIESRSYLKYFDVGGGSDCVASQMTMDSKGYIYTLSSDQMTSNDAVLAKLDHRMTIKWDMKVQITTGQGFIALSKDEAQLLLGHPSNPFEMNLINTADGSLLKSLGLTASQDIHSISPSNMANTFYIGVNNIIMRYETSGDTLTMKQFSQGTATLAPLRVIDRGTTSSPTQMTMMVAEFGMTQDTQILYIMSTNSTMDIQWVQQLTCTAGGVQPCGMQGMQVGQMLVDEAKGYVFYVGRANNQPVYLKLNLATGAKIALKQPPINSVNVYTSVLVQSNLFMYGGGHMFRVDVNSDTLLEVVQYPYQITHSVRDRSLDPSYVHHYGIGQAGSISYCVLGKFVYDITEKYDPEITSTIVTTTFPDSTTLAVSIPAGLSQSVVGSPPTITSSVTPPNTHGNSLNLLTTHGAVSTIYLTGSLMKEEFVQNGGSKSLAFNVACTLAGGGTDVRTKTEVKFRAGIGENTASGFTALPAWLTLSSSTNEITISPPAGQTGSSLTVDVEMFIGTSIVRSLVLLRFFNCTIQYCTTCTDALTCQTCQSGTTLTATHTCHMPNTTIPTSTTGNTTTTPTATSEPKMEAQVQSAAITSQTFTGASATVSVVFQSIPTLFLLMNLLQLFLLIPLLNITIPPQLLLFLKQFQFTTFDMSFLNMDIPYLKQIVSIDDKMHVDPKLATIGFTSGSTYVNEFSYLQMLNILIFIHLLIMPCVLMQCKHQILKTIQDVLTSLFHFTIYIKFGLTAFLFFTILSLTEIVRFNITSQFTIVSLCLAGFFLACNLWILIFIPTFYFIQRYRNKTPTLDTSMFKAYYSDTKPWILPRLYYFFFLLRRLVSITIIMTLNSWTGLHPLAQLIPFDIVQVANLIALVAIRPSRYVKNNLIEIMVEGVFVVCCGVVTVCHTEAAWVGKDWLRGLVVYMLMAVCVIVFVVLLIDAVIRFVVWVLKLIKWLKGLEGRKGEKYAVVSEEGEGEGVGPQEPSMVGSVRSSQSGDMLDLAKVDHPPVDPLEKPSPVGSNKVLPKFQDIGGKLPMNQSVVTDVPMASTKTQPEAPPLSPTKPNMRQKLPPISVPDQFKDFNQMELERIQKHGKRILYDNLDPLEDPKSQFGIWDLEDIQDYHDIAQKKRELKQYKNVIQRAIKKKHRNQIE